MEATRRSTRIKNLNTRPIIPDLTPLGLPKKKKLTKKATSITDIYTNAQYTDPAPRALETIYEDSPNGKILGRKFHRAFYFETDPSKRKSRRKKQNKARIKKQVNLQKCLLINKNAPTTNFGIHTPPKTRKRKRKSLDNRSYLDDVLENLERWEREFELGRRKKKFFDDCSDPEKNNNKLRKTKSI